MVGVTFIPNRIFRGRVIEALRDAPTGLTLGDIGRQIALDWDPDEPREWLKGVVCKLLTDRLIREQRGKFLLG